MIGLALSALSFLGGNWKLALPLIGMLALGAWGGWQYLGRVEAEDALARQNLKIIEDDNAAWTELNRKRQDFEKEVREGLGALRDEVAATRATNAEFQKRVVANENSKRALDPVERDALRVLSNNDNSDKASRRGLRPADAPSLVR